MRTLTGKQMREADRIAICEMGIPGMDLMEKAGEAAFQELLSMMEELLVKGETIVESDSFVIILCGGGNNGGDGYVVARKMLEAQDAMKVYALSDPQKLKGDAKTAFERFEKAGGKLDHQGLAGVLNKLDVDLRGCSAIVDAILGTGIDRPVRDELHGVIDLVNSSGRPVLAVDVPSGINGDDGRVYGAAVKATKTVTFQAAKLGLTVEPGWRFCGEIKVVDIGLPKEALLKAAQRF